jgi:hypothetical protein
MIKLIGTKRLFLLSLLIMIIVILAAFYFLWMEPVRKDAEQKLAQLDSQIRTLRNDIVNIKEDIRITERNIPYFEQLDGSGFFKSQDRFQAERLIQEVRAESGVQSTNFAIDPLVDIDDKRATDADHRLIMSNIKVSGIQAYTDIDIYRFVYLMNNGFPGHTRLKSLQIERSSEVTPGNLDKMNDAENRSSFVTATAEFQWLTMLEEDDDDSASGMGGARR